MQSRLHSRLAHRRKRTPTSVLMRVMRRGSATNNGRGDEPDAGIGMHHGMEWAIRNRTFAACERTIMFDFPCVFSIWLFWQSFRVFKTTLLKLLNGNVTFIEIMRHETIVFRYLSKNYRDAVFKFRASRDNRSARTVFPSGWMQISGYPGVTRGQLERNAAPD